MGKTQEHSDDVRRKVVELHKSRNGHKKISKELKIPISTIMEIIKKFKATGDVKNQPGRGRVCTLTPGGGWFDWKNNLQGSQLENCRGELSLRVRKSPKLPSDDTYITTSCFGGLPEKSLCCQSTAN